MKWTATQTRRLQDAMVQEFRDTHLSHNSSSNNRHHHHHHHYEHEDEEEEWLNPIANQRRVPHQHQHQQEWLNPVAASSSQGRKMVPSRTTTATDEEGLILPRKLVNPCLESREVQDLNKQIKWNAKAGVNVLGSKSELEKALARRKAQRADDARRREDDEAKSDFQRVLEERAKKMEHLDPDTASSVLPCPSPTSTSKAASGDSGHCSPEPESEFLKVHAQLKGGARTRACT